LKVWTAFVSLVVSEVVWLFLPLLDLDRKEKHALQLLEEQLGTIIFIINKSQQSGQDNEHWSGRLRESYNG
jgi:hypothetical protein